MSTALNLPLLEVLGVLPLPLAESQPVARALSLPHNKPTTTTAAANRINNKNNNNALPLNKLLLQQLDEVNPLVTSLHEPMPRQPIHLPVVLLPILHLPLQQPRQLLLLGHHETLPLPDRSHKHPLIIRDSHPIQISILQTFLPLETMRLLETTATMTTLQMTLTMPGEKRKRHRICPVHIIPVRNNTMTQFSYPLLETPRTTHTRQSVPVKTLPCQNSWLRQRTNSEGLLVEPVPAVAVPRRLPSIQHLPLRHPI